MADAVQGSGPILTPEARLELARSLEERQQHGDALLAYYRAIIESQRQGRWLEQGDDAARSSSSAWRMPCAT